jgi:DNA-binding MarR family transcriptional regulator
VRSRALSARLSRSTCAPTGCVRRYRCRAAPRTLDVGLAAVTGITHRLSARGLIRRAVDAHDRRIRRIYLTPKGSATIAVLRDAGRTNKRRLLRKLDAEALQKMADAMDALNEATEEES